MFIKKGGFFLKQISHNFSLFIVLTKICKISILFAMSVQIYDICDFLILIYVLNKIVYGFALHRFGKRLFVPASIDIISVQVRSRISMDHAIRVYHWQYIKRILLPFVNILFYVISFLFSKRFFMISSQTKDPTVSPGCCLATITMVFFVLFYL
jgi:hypothetical protein